MGVEWRGGDVVRFPGGGHKVNMLRPVVEQWKDEADLVVMFVDRYAVRERERDCVCSSGGVCAQL